MNTRDHYTPIDYVPGHDFFAGAIVVDEQGLWHITTPLGALSPRAYALSHPMSAEDREEMVLQAYPRLRGDPRHDSRARR